MSEQYAVIDFSQDGGIKERVLVRWFRGEPGMEVRWTDTCSGCFNSEDGHPIGEYPIHPKHHCYVGSGCQECGYHGVVRRREWAPLSSPAREIAIRKLTAASPEASGEGPVGTQPR